MNVRGGGFGAISDGVRLLVVDREEYIRQVAEQAPPLRPEQISRLLALLDTGELADAVTLGLTPEQVRKARAVQGQFSNPRVVESLSVSAVPVPPL